MSTSNIKSLQDFSPLIAFVIGFFILNIFGIQAATDFLVAALLATLAFMVEVKILRDDYQIRRENNKRLNFLSGLLSLFVLIIFFNGFLHWNKIIALNYRMFLLLVLVLVFIVALFRAMRVLSEIKQKSLKKHKK